MNIPAIAKPCRFLPMVFVLSGCASRDAPPVDSPDGSMTLRTHIEQDRATRGGYHCVVFEIVDRAGQVLHSENTHASDVMRWSMDWIADDLIELKSSDIGARRRRRQPGGAWKLADL